MTQCELKKLADELEIDQWIETLCDRFTPEEWADHAMAALQIKHTKRAALRHDLAEVFRDAQIAAVRNHIRK